MVKILMINPVVREEDDPKHIPYGMALLAQIAIDKGHQVQFYDENAWRKGPEVKKQVLCADDWEVVAIGGLITTYKSVKETLKMARKLCPQAKIVAGGGFFTSMPLDMMEWLPEIDLGVVGEGFVTWPVVLEKIANNDLDFSETLGVCYRNEEGKGVLNFVRPNIADMDVLPYPAWDLLPVEEVYFKNSQLLFSEDTFKLKKRMDINGSLGCSLVCKYCWHLGTTGDMIVEANEDGVNDVRFTYGRNIRYHSPEYIVKMVKTLVDKYEVDFVSFIDENLLTMHVASRRTWLYDLCNLWIEEGLQPLERRDPNKPYNAYKGGRGVFWAGTSHAGLVDDDVLKAMYSAGCSYLVYGLESFDPKILKNLGKGSSQKANLNSVGRTLKSGIIPIPNIIIGFPEESFESIEITIKCMEKLGIHAKPHFATPYPGSEWYNVYKDSILEQYDGDLEAFVSELGDATKITATISHKFSSVQLLGLQEIVAKKDLRLLQLAKKHWANCDEHITPLAVPKESFNMISKKVQAPIEKTTQSI
ncbi:B12-binding domain-containing radical SAM protein [Candidatus Uabimicrobium amorphum]|uniref:Radical SAM protein n=1 Tax=Uabimicrobium amorphum TaxID=2596890 RepID=A0A5S9ITY9_UABAM|nr:radical SAM protein [Candidatus Uabimicrobium amorphum]BBM87894.1 radical SAM protein [Candidatus Uabimicrobium amorphum]